jgi:hypothetical protein
MSSLCRIIDDIIDNNRLTIKILWLAIIMGSSTCFGAGIVAVVCYSNYLSILMLAFGGTGMLVAVSVYIVKVILPVNSALP